MKKIFFYFIIIALCSSFSSNSSAILGDWIWEKSIFYTQKESYEGTPKILGYNIKITFTKDRKVITYKNNIEIRVSKYEITRGISVIDQLEHDLISFENATYVIENIDDKNLIIARNINNGNRSIYKKRKY